MDETIQGPFSVHSSGNVGQVICDPDGQIIAWTTDSWVAVVIAGLLNRNEHLLFMKKEKQQ